MAARLGASWRASQTAPGASPRSTPRLIATRSHHTDSHRHADDSRAALVAGLSTLAAGLLISAPANAALLGESNAVASQPPERSRYVMLERQRLERLVVSEFEARLSELSDGELADMLEDMLRSRRAGISAAELMGRAGRPAPSTSAALNTSTSTSSQQQQQGSSRRGATDSTAPGQDSRQPMPAQGSGGGGGIDWLLSPLSDLRGQLAPEVSSEPASPAVATSSAGSSTGAGSGGGGGMAGLFQGGLGLGGLMGGGGGAAPTGADAPGLPAEAQRASTSLADGDSLAVARARDMSTQAPAPFDAARDTYTGSSAGRDAAELGRDAGAGAGAGDAAGAGTVASVGDEDEEQDFTSQLMARLMGGQQPGPAAPEPPPPSPSSSAASGAGAEAQRDALVAGMMGALGSALSQLPGGPGVEPPGAGADPEALAQQPQGPLVGLQLPSLQAPQLPALPSISAPSLPDVGPALEAAGAVAAGVAGVAGGVAGGVRDLAEGIADGSVAEAAAQVLVPVGLVAAGTAGVVAISYLTEPPQQSSTAADAEQPQASAAASPPAPVAASSRAAAEADPPPQQQAAQAQVAAAPEPGIASTGSTATAGGGLLGKLSELGSGLMSFARNTKQQQSDAPTSSTATASAADSAPGGRASVSATTAASTGLAATQPASGAATATVATTTSSRASRLQGLLDNGPPLPLPGPPASSAPLGGLNPDSAAPPSGDGALAGVADGGSGGGGILWERSEEPATAAAAGPGPVLWQRAESTPAGVRGLPQARQAPPPPQPPRFPPPRPPPVMPSGGPQLGPSTAGGFGTSMFGPDVAPAPQRVQGQMPQGQMPASAGSAGTSFPVPPDPWRSEPAAAGAATAAAGVVGTSRAEGSQERPAGREAVASGAAGGDAAGSSPWDSPR